MHPPLSAAVPPRQKRQRKRYFGFSGIKHYASTGYFYSYFSSDYAKRMLGDLIFFVSEEEAQAKGFTCSDIFGREYKDKTSKELAAAIRDRLRDMYYAVEKLCQAHNRPLSWFRRRIVEDVSEKEAVAVLAFGWKDLEIVLGTVVSKLKLEQEEMEKALSKLEYRLNVSEISQKQTEEKLQQTEAELQQTEGKLRRTSESLQEAKDGLVKKQAYSQNLSHEVEKNKQLVQDLSEQLSALQQKSADETQSLTIAKKRLEELENEKELLLPGVMDNEIIASFFSYLRRFQAAIGRVEGASSETKEVAVKGNNGMLPCWSINLNRDYVDTLVYSYDPSEVAFAYMQLGKVMEKARDGEREKRRLVWENILGSFSGILGYDNLWRYLIQVEASHKDSQFVRFLCDLCVPNAKVLGFAFDLTADPWLAKHMPPTDKTVNASCYITLNRSDGKHVNSLMYGSRESEADINYTDDINTVVAKAIIETEKANLLHFRKSLSLALSLLVPLSDKEQEQALSSTEKAEEQASSPEQQAPRQEHHFRYIEHLHKVKSDLYIVRYEYRNPSLIALPITTELIFNGKGEVFHPSE